MFGREQAAGETFFDKVALRLVVFVPMIGVSKSFQNLSTVMNFNSAVLVTFQLFLPSLMLIMLSKEREQIFKLNVKKAPLPIQPWRVRLAYASLVLGLQSTLLGLRQVSSGEP